MFYSPIYTNHSKTIRQLIVVPFNMHNAIPFVLFGLVAYFANTATVINNKVFVQFQLTLIFFLSTVCQGQSSFDITLQKFEPFTMTEKDYFDPGTLRVGRKKRNVFVISGNCSIFKNLGDEIMV